jgi:hypothetical protein
MLSEPVPIKECVGEIFLKKASFEVNERYEAVKFSFTRRGQWINMLIVNPEKKEDIEATKKARYRAALKIESVASIFLDEETMRECFIGADSFQSFSEALVAELERTDYKSVELEGKLLPGPKFGYTVPFLRRKGDRKRQLFYSDYELKTLQNAWNQ